MRRSLAALVVALLACGCTTAPSSLSVSSVAPPVASPAASASPRPVASSPVEVQVVEIFLKDGRATPSGDRLALKKGTVLRLEITSDHADEVHVHGYEVEIEVEAGATVTKNVTLDQGGRFEIESHEPALTILQLVVS